MKRFLNGVCIIAGLLILLSCSDARAADKPNVLFIAIDDLNDWVGYLGGHPQARTPHIDKLAREGTAFASAYCPAPVCGPSRTALMYGIAPHESGSYGHHATYDPAKLIEENQWPLNLVFQNNGYHTAGCGKIFHYPERRGWDEFFGGGGGMTADNPKKVGGLDYGIVETDNDSDTGDGRLTDWAIGQLQREHEKPFFIAMGLKKPHLPWEAPRKYFEQFDLQTVQLPPSPDDDLDDLPEEGKVFAESMVGFRSPDDHGHVLRQPGAWRELVQAYLATISFADANVGRLLEALEKSPHRDKTIVVLWGDHGWHLGEKKHWRKMTLWEQGTRTSFIIKMPGCTPGRIQAPVSLQDIFPTLVDLCGLEVTQALDGNNLKPLLMNPAEPWDKPVLMSHGPGNFAVRQGHWRLIRYARGGEEFYDLEADPNEHTNLAGSAEHEAIRQQLRKHLPTGWLYVMGPRFENFADSFAEAPGEK